MRKLMLLAAAAVGYVLGTRAGRERYDQIMGMASRVKDDPRVQEKAHQAMDVAKERAPVMADKVVGAASAAASKVTGSEGAHVDSREPHMAGPQGDLP
jgi:hypothetical protein